MPIWPPGAKVDLGDVGVFDKRGFLFKTRLEDLGIRIERSSPREEGPSLKIQSARTSVKETSASLSADVTATATGAGKLEVSFGGEGDFALRAANVNSTRINNIVAVEDSISELLSLGTWKRNWVYVQEVVVGAPCIFLVASARSKHAAVQAAASGDQALSFAAQMDARAGFRVESDDTLSYEIADLGPTPFMWRGRCLRSWPSRSMTDRGDGSESAFKELIEYDQGIDDEDDDL